MRVRVIMTIRTNRGRKEEGEEEIERAAGEESKLLEEKRIFKKHENQKPIKTNSRQHPRL